MTHHDLLACPFCGWSHLALDQDKMGDWCVSCLNCAAKGPRDDVDTAAMMAWNRRVAAGLSAAPCCPSTDAQASAPEPQEP